MPGNLVRVDLHTYEGYLGTSKPFSFIVFFFVFLTPPLWSAKCFRSSAKCFCFRLAKCFCFRLRNAFVFVCEILLFSSAKCLSSSAKCLFSSAKCLFSSAKCLFSSAKCLFSSRTKTTVNQNDSENNYNYNNNKPLAQLRFWEADMQTDKADKTD